MSFLKCSLLSFATAVATAIFAMLPASSLAQSTDYRFEPNSTMTLFLGLGGAEVFDISGSFTLNENPSVASITDAVFDLSPGTPNPLDFVFPNSDISPAPEFDDFLETLFFPEVPSIASQTAYLSDSFIDNVSVNVSIAIDNVSANRLLTLSGFIDAGAAVDAPSLSFSATAVAVPEPTGLPVCLLLAITFIARRQRSASSALCLSV